MKGKKNIDRLSERLQRVRKDVKFRSDGATFSTVVKQAEAGTFLGNVSITQMR